MSPGVRKVLVALAAAAAGSLGAALGQVACDVIKERFTPTPEAKRRRQRRAA